MANQIKVISNVSEKIFEEEVNLFLKKGFEIINTEIIEKNDEIVFIAILEGEAKVD